MALNPDHILEHDDISALVNAQSARFGRAQLLPIVNLEGDPGHLTLHNSIRAELAAIATAAGKTYTVALPPVRSLGESGHAPEDHEAYRVAVVEAATWPAWNSATGGTIADKTNYNGTGQKWRTHTFTTNGTLNVSQAAQPFRVLVVGGGDSGASWHHAWGWTPPAGANGAAILDNARALTVGSHPAAPGAATPGPGPYAGCNPGSTSTFHGISARAGNGVTTDIDGTNKPWPGSGYGVAGTSYITSVDGDPNYGRAGGTGEPGIVIVAYRIG
jgi:hypothetical protein